MCEVCLEGVPTVVSELCSCDETWATTVMLSRRSGLAKPHHTGYIHSRLARVDYGWHLTRTLRRFPLISIIIRTQRLSVSAPHPSTRRGSRLSTQRIYPSQPPFPHECSGSQRESTSCRHHCSVESVMYRRPHRPPSPHLPRPQLRQTGSFYFPWPSRCGWSGGRQHGPLILLSLFRAQRCTRAGLKETLTNRPIKLGECSRHLGEKKGSEGVLDLVRRIANVLRNKDSRRGRSTCGGHSRRRRR